MKSIFTYIFASFLIATFVYGSQEIQYYQESPWHTPEEWKKIPSLDYPWITAEEEEIAAERAMRRLYKVGTWKALDNYIKLIDSYSSTGFATPEGQDRSVKKLMEKAQRCLENIHKEIDQNIKCTKKRIKYHLKNDLNHHHSQDCFDLQESKRRLKIYDANYHHMEIRSKTMSH